MKPASASLFAITVFVYFYGLLALTLLRLP